MTAGDSEFSTTHRTASRRSVLKTLGTIVAAGTAISSVASAQSDPDFGGWFDGVPNYDGVVDETGADEVTVTVGPPDVPGGPYVFEPAAIRVDPGTTVTWEWSGEGGMHDVVDEGGAFESDLTDEGGHTFSQTFDKETVYRFYCNPHRKKGMRGAVLVGGAQPSTGDGGPSGGSDGSGSFIGGPRLPGNDFERTFIFAVFGIMGLSVLVALASDIGSFARWCGPKLRDIGYGIHRRSGFRSRPAASTGVGWITVGIVLLAISAVVVGLWSIGFGATGLLAGLGLLALLFVAYASRTVGVDPLPGRAAGTTSGDGPRTTPVRGSGTRLSGRTRQSLARIARVARGWVSIVIVAFVAVGVPVTLWEARGTVGLLGGLVFLALLIAVYSTSSRT